MEEIKRCPFCGKNVAVLDHCKGLEDCLNFEVCEGEGWKVVVCDFNKGGCGASSGYFKTKAEAITAWNRRFEGCS